MRKRIVWAITALGWAVAGHGDVPAGEIECMAEGLERSADRLSLKMGKNDFFACFAHRDPGSQDGWEKLNLAPETLVETGEGAYRATFTHTDGTAALTLAGELALTRDEKSRALCVRYSLVPDGDGETDTAGLTTPLPPVFTRVRWLEEGAARRRTRMRDDPDFARTHTRVRAALFDDEKGHGMLVLPAGEEPMCLAFARAPQGHILLTHNALAGVRAFSRGERFEGAFRLYPVSPGGWTPALQELFGAPGRAQMWYNIP